MHKVFIFIHLYHQTNIEVYTWPLKNVNNFSSSSKHSIFNFEWHSSTPHELSWIHPWMQIIQTYHICIPQTDDSTGEWISFLSHFVAKFLQFLWNMYDPCLALLSLIFVSSFSCIKHLLATYHTYSLHGPHMTVLKFTSQSFVFVISICIRVAGFPLPDSKNGSNHTSGKRFSLSKMAETRK